MSLKEIAQRVVLSLFLLGLAVLLSFTSPAAEAYNSYIANNLVIPASLTRISHLPDNFQRRITTESAPVVQKNPPFACAACDLPHTNPTFAITLWAVLADVLVMASLIYGGSFLAGLKFS